MNYKIKLKLTIQDKIVEFISWLILIGIWMLIFIRYDSLPDKIPTHYNILGEPDSFNSKESIFILQIVCTFLFLGLTVINMFPHLFNFPYEITKDNAQFQYKKATQLIRNIKLVINLIFGAIVVETLSYSEKKEGIFGEYFFPLTFFLIITPVIYYFLSIKNKKGRL